MNEMFFAAVESRTEEANSEKVKVKVKRQKSRFIAGILYGRLKRMRSSS